MQLPSSSSDILYEGFGKKFEMDDIPTLPKWKHLWDTWNLRGFMILSLVLQIFLIFLAPLRKRTSSFWIITPLWFFYLLADWVANFALGLITNGQGNPSDLGGAVAVDKDLLAFWAPFLLIHLGGPDTITAFALEDNEFWLRHLLSLGFQFSATVYMFVQSLPNYMLWFPTILMIVNGTIKYTERTLAFYLASVYRFKSSMLANDHPGMNYVGLKEDNYPMEDVKSDTSNMKPDDLTYIEVLQHANDFFNMFKGLYVDLIFTRKTRKKSRDFFLNRTAKDAFEVVEVELNFFYEALFTKLPVVCGYFGFVTRLLSFVTVCLAIIFFKIENKTKFSNIDVKITYGLLFGALTLDIVAQIMLLISSKTMISLSNLSMPGTEFLTRTINRILRDPKEEAQTPGIRPIDFLKRRWSNSIPTYNLINFCLHPRSRFKQLIIEKLGVSSFLDGFKYVKAKRFTTELRDFIFEELKLKSHGAAALDTAMDINSSRGDRVLRDANGWSDLLPHTLDNDFGQRVLLWHITTDLCYSKELSDRVKSKRLRKPNSDHHREIAKLLSDYMMYLLIMKPSTMTAITSIVQIQFWDLCANVGSTFHNEKTQEMQNPLQGSSDGEVDWAHLNACMKIFSQNEMRLNNMKGDVTKPLLVYSFILAKEVMKIEEEDPSLNKWEIICKVWVELLCYAASHSHAKMQAAQVSNGGDLITIVWLLMAHFGLGDQFQIDKQQQRARRFVD